MANSITKSIDIDIVSPRGQDLGTLKQITADFDTVATPLEIVAPVTGERWFVIGLLYGLGAAHGITLYSNATTIVTYDIGSSGSYFANNSSAYFPVTEIGEGLSASIETIAAAVITFHVTTSPQLATFHLGVAA